MLDAHFALQDQKLLGDLSQLEVFVNGSFCRAEDAKISVWDHGLLYGDGIFEGIRAYQGGVFKLNAHLERLFESAKAIGMTLPYGLKELSEVVLETLKRNQLQDAHVRVLVTRGIGKPGVSPVSCVQPGLVIMAYPFPPLLGEKPARLITSSVTCTGVYYLHNVVGCEERMTRPSTRTRYIERLSSRRMTTLQSP